MAKEDAKVVIGGDAQKAVNAIKDVTQHMGSMGKGMNDFLSQATGFFSWQTAAVAGLGAVAAGFGAMISKAIDTADEFANMSKRTGLATESLSKLAYAAKMSDVSNETLQKSLKFLNISLYDVAAGNKQAIDKFKEFGVEIINADGTIKNAESALLAVAEAYTNLDSEAAKTKLATELFGKAGQELMPMLSEGATGIKNLTDEAKKLGLEVDGTTAASAERLNDNLDKMKSFTSGVAMAMLDDLVPAMDAFSNSAEKSIQGGSAFWTELKMINEAAMDSIGIFGALGDAVKVFLGWQSLANAEYKSLMSGKKFDPAKDFDVIIGNPFNSVNSPIDRFIKDRLYPDKKKKKNSGNGTAGGSSSGSGKTSNDDDLVVVRERYVNLFAEQEKILAMLAQQYAPESLFIWRSFFSFPDELAQVATSQTDPLGYLADYQRDAVEMWAKYYEQLEKMGTTNFILMSQTTQDLFGGMSEAMTGFGNLMSSQAGKTEQDYRAMFEIGKAFKSAEIVTSTYSAAVKAYESQVGIPIVGPYLAVAAAASAVAFGTAQLANLWASQPGQSSISGGGTAPTPNFATRNPQTGGGDSGGNRTVIIKYEGLIYGDKDKIARDLYDAFAKAGRDGVGR